MIDATTEKSGQVLEVVPRKWRREGCLPGMFADSIGILLRCYWLKQGVISFMDENSWIQFWPTACQV